MYEALSFVVLQPLRSHQTVSSTLVFLEPVGLCLDCSSCTVAGFSRREMGHRGSSSQEAALLVWPRGRGLRPPQKAEPQAQWGVAFYAISTSLFPMYGDTYSLIRHSPSYRVVSELCIRA